MLNSIESSGHVLRRSDCTRWPELGLCSLTAWKPSLATPRHVLLIFLYPPLTRNPPKAPDVTSDIRHALDQAGLNDVSVSQDREKSVVTLTGKVASDDDKSKAE